MTGFVSYAQNFEDVMLWRALKHVEGGFYIDVGAQDPIVDSVSKGFYERGWRGIHVEPTATFANMLRSDRPDEQVVQAAITDRPGLIRFFEIPVGGLSTGCKNIAEEHERKLGCQVVETVVAGVTLDDVLSLAPTDDIHWLKVDVEGFEKQVFSSWRKSKKRPWVIVVEATYPNSPVDTYAEWEPLVLAKGYSLVYRDGLNRFYLSDAHGELHDHFQLPPNVFDGFQLSGTATSLTRNLVDRLTADQRAVTAELAEVRSTLDGLQAEAAVREREFGKLIESGVSGARAEVDARTRELLDRERSHADQLEKLLREARSREDRLRADFDAALADARAETRALLERMREAEAEQAREREALRQAAEAREDRLRQELTAAVEAARADARASQERLAEREAAHARDLEALRQATEALAKELRERERQSSERLTALDQGLAAIASELQVARQSLWRKLFGKRNAIHADAEARLLPAISPQDQASTASSGNQRLEAMARGEKDRHVTDMDALLSLPSEQFIRQAYRLILGREADVEGLAYYTKRLRSGISRRQILAQLYFSPEGQGRDVKLPGLEKAIGRYLWRKRLGVAMESFSLAKPRRKPLESPVMSVDQLLSIHDEKFVRSAFQAILGRDPDLAGLKHYLTQVRRGTSKRQVIADLAMSRESRAYQPRVSGLRPLVRLHRWRKRPIVGFLIKSLGLGEDPVNLSRTLRVIENQLERIVDLGEKIQKLENILEGDRKALGKPQKHERSHKVDVFSVGHADEVIYYYVDHTVLSPANTGMQRVVRRLGRALVDQGKTVYFVKWSADRKRFCLINQHELEHLAKWGGPNLPNEEVLRYPAEGAVVEVEGMSVGKAGKAGWLLVPEVTHVTFQEVPPTLDIIREAKRLSLRSAFIYYDAIPLRLKEYSETADKHEEYMQALLLADLVIPISRASAKELDQFFRQHQRATFLPYKEPINLPGVPHSAPRVIEPRTGLIDKKTILCVGSIEPRKNQLKLIEAFQGLPKEIADEWSLVFAGHLGPQIADAFMAKVKASKNIRYVPHPSDDELDELFRSASFTVFPSVEEGFGLPILESLWYAVPCICGNFGAMAEVAEGGGCVTIDTRNVNEIRSAIIRLCTDGNFLFELSRQAAKRRLVTWGDYGKEVARLLRSISNSANRIRAIYYWVDDTASNSHNSGIQRVVRQTARALIESGVNVIPVKWDAAARRCVPASGDDLSNLARWNGPKSSDWAEWVEPAEMPEPRWLLIPELVHGKLGDVREFAHSVRMRCAAIFFDAIPYKMKEVFPAAFADNHLRYMEEISGFDKVFAISRYSLAEYNHFLLCRRFRTPSAENRFKAIPLPWQFTGYPRVAAIRQSVGAAEEVRILAVISIEPRKNPLVLIDAFAKASAAASRRLRLTIVGRRIERFADLANELLSRLERMGNATWLQDVDDDRLRELYREATFTVFPSIEEGFGLPIVESLWNGKPCIVHHDGAMAEAAEGGGCVLVDMRDVDALADAIVAVANDDDWRRELAETAASRPMRGWSDYAREIVDQLANDRLSEGVRRVPYDPGNEVYEELPLLHNRPLLSVCISTYNRAKWLRLSLQNLFTQLVNPTTEIEVLVVDNASTDDTPIVVEPYLQRPDFHYQRNAKNVGMLGNLAVCAHRARGEYIWILGDDDLVKPGGIGRVLEAIKRHPGVGLIYLNYAYTREKEPEEIGDLSDFFHRSPAIVPPTEDQYAATKSVATNNENFFTAIYCLVFRRDHAIRAYSQDTSGRPFSSMRTSIPTTYYVLNYMMDEPAYWIGEPVVVVNFNVSWNQYASLQILERVPEALDLAERMGADGTEVDRWRLNLVPGFEHYWREIYEDDPLGNSEFFSAERVIMRMKHLDGFAAVAPSLAAIYDRAFRGGHPKARLPTSRLFCSFDLRGIDNDKVS